MELTQIKEGLIRAITEIQVASGRLKPNITDNTRPMADLTDFDSLNAMETTFLLSEYFECEIESNLILSTSLGQPRTIIEASRLLYDIINGGQPDEQGNGQEDTT